MSKMLVAIALIFGFMAAAQGEGPSVEDYKKSAQGKLEQGDVPGAIADYTKAMSLDPQNPWLLIFRGILRRENGDLQLSFVDLADAQKLAQGNAEAMLKDGVEFSRTLNAMHDYNNAIEFLDLIIRDYPDCTDAYIERAWARLGARGFRQGAVG